MRTGVGGHPSSLCHPRVSVVGDPSPLRSYPQFVAGIHPKGTQDGCPIKNVGHDRLFCHLKRANSHITSRAISFQNKISPKPRFSLITKIK